MSSITGITNFFILSLQINVLLIIKGQILFNQFF